MKPEVLAYYARCRDEIFSEFVDILKNMREDSVICLKAYPHQKDKWGKCTRLGSEWTVSEHDLKTDNVLNIEKYHNVEDILDMWTID